MIYFILYLLLVPVIWMVTCKVYQMYGYERINGNTYHNVKTDDVTDIPPGVIALFWPIVLPIWLIFSGFIQLGRFLSYADKKLWSIATSINIKVEKKNKS